MANKNNVNGNPGLSANLLPRFYQTKANKKFLQSTIDQLFQPGTLTKVSGYIGRENAKASTGTDVYVEAADQVRQNYQLEPGITIKDKLGNVTFFKDYIDYINQINVFGGNTNNHARLNKQEFYSWDPHIDWDKFVNFQNYYWLPYGPDDIKIYGNQLGAASTYTVEIQNEGSNNQYLFTPNGFTPNPVLKLYKGQTYTFNINSPGNPFSFKTSRTTGNLDRYKVSGLDSFAVELGTITFTVPANAPSILYYQSESDINLGGSIQIAEITDNTAIDLQTDLLGKKTYTLSNGTKLSNGMKVSFGGHVTPAEYANGQYYVEGVGRAIKLIKTSVLEVVSPYTVEQAIEFDSVPWDKEPFDNATGFAGSVDYITINRASSDHNPWSRYNRWFHKDVISASAAYNNNIVSLDQTNRAIRPIIEFEADLKLYNLGTTAIFDIDLVDNFTSDVFSTIEGTSGYNVDGVDLVPNTLVLFTADKDPLVQNKIYRVEYVDVKHLSTGSNQLHLVEVATPATNQVVLVRQGRSFQSQMFWFDGSNWIQGQQKTSVNQAPMFDVFDNNGISFGDKSVYKGSSFSGTSLFSYKIGTSGTADPKLGFILSYQNVSNIGDIVFNFNLATDTFEYKKTAIVEKQSIEVGYLSKLDYAGNSTFVNGWQLCTTDTVQAAVRIYKNSGLTNNFKIDIFDDINKLEDLIVKVYINGIRLDQTKWSITSTSAYKKVVLKTDIGLSDVLTIRAFANQPINSNGYYETPLNLQSNSLNATMGDFTLGEVTDHLNSIIDNLTDTNSASIRDLGNITQYGTKFVQHSGPLSLALYHITSENNNIIKGLEQARDDYNNFKRNFINVAGSLGVDGNPIAIVNMILNKINGNTPNVAPYYFSDMVPYGACTVTDIKVVDSRIKIYPLTAVFSLDVLSNKAVGVYQNGTQLVHGRDYTFNSQGFVVIDTSVNLTVGDTISTYEYDSTDGSFVPATPSKLGMWPAYVPQLYLDTTLVNPQLMIQGHDGSKVLAYGDYRDNLILELEKRIYNNIKIKYNADIFDVADIIPSYNRKTDYSRTEFNAVIAPNFYKWTSLVGKDLTTPLSYDRANSFTYNYSLNIAPDNTSLPGYWRGVYNWLLDTDRPHICPWEMLGFNEEPAWWTSVYGPSPYTKDNIPMWKDINDGMVREPGVPAKFLKKYAKPFLLEHIPVDESGNLISPLESGLASGSIQPSIDNNFVFGDGSPVEAAWSRSSYYPFAIIISSILLNPAKTFGTLLDRSRIVRNLAGQLVYADTNLRIKPSDIILPSTYSSSTRIQTAGLINYIVDLIFNYIFSDNIQSYNIYKNDLSTMTPRLSYRVGSFTSETQFNLLLESKTPSSKGNVFVPAEDYKVFLNKSSPVKKLIYSGVIITKLSTGFEIKGYSISQPYFHYYPYTNTGTTINVGGISENFSTWTANQLYVVGSVVSYNNTYYRAITTHTSSTTFASSNFAALSGGVPMIGGTTATLRTSWDKTTPIVVPYGTLFTSIQDVVDFLLGYGAYLKDQGFLFDGYNTNYAAVSNWENSAKEFLFWTTQNWSSGQDKWSEWEPNQPYTYGTVVSYNGDYYSAIYNIPVSSLFEYDKWNKLDGLSNIGSSVISLSPGANGLTFTTNLTVVDSISNNFNTYEIFKVNGTPFDIKHLDSYRDGNTVNYTPKLNEGIYGASFYLIQNEHVVVVNNTTIFNDIIYSPTSGYRQERLKVSGYVTTGWYGGLDIPGFIFDAADIQLWQPYKDYNTGDIVSHQSYYYSADTFVAGTPVFVPSSWTQLSGKPISQILPNWTNSATQFTDFYSSEVDSFDSGQQTMAHHLIGYQKRQYLNNIIQDDVSEFKFYQGMIREKGTQNVLNKLFGVLNNDNLESLTFYEEWALRVGQYGSPNAFEDFEIILDQARFTKNNPQGVLLVDKLQSDINPFIIQKTPNDIYVKPLGYNSSPFPVLTEDKSFLRNSGNVNASDVLVSLGNISDLLGQSVSSMTVGLSYKILTVGTTDFTQLGAVDNNVGTSFVTTGKGTGTGTVVLDISQIQEGSYIWCAFDAGNSWNVYRFTDLNIRITNVTVSNKVMTLTTSSLVPLSVGSYIGIILEVPAAQKITGLDGFYQITSITLNSFTVATTVASVPVPFTLGANLVVHGMTTQHAKSIDNIDTIIPPRLKNGDYVWTDDGTGTSWIYNPVYSQLSFTPEAPSTNLQFGHNVAISNQGKIAAVTMLSGQIATYDKVGESVSWIQRQYIQAPVIAINNANTLDKLATVVAISSDGTWLATGSPNAGYAATKMSSHNNGVYDPTYASYVVGDIVSYNGFYKAILSVPVGSIPSLTSVYWDEIQYVPVDTLGNNSSLASQGAVSIYIKDRNNIYSLVDTIVSPNMSANENFGSALAFDNNNNLYVAAPGYNNNTGRVYALNYASNILLSAQYDYVGSTGTTVKLSSSLGITSGMIVAGTGFTSGQAVSSVLTKLKITLVAGAPNYILNTQSAAINLSSIASGMSVIGSNVLPGVSVVGTGSDVDQTGTIVDYYILVSGPEDMSSLVSAFTLNVKVTGVFPSNPGVGLVTLTFDKLPVIPFTSGSTVTISGISASGYNGSFTVVSCSTSTMTYYNDTVAQASGGTIANPALTFTINSVESANTIIVSKAPDSNPVGILTFSTLGWKYGQYVNGSAPNSNFGTTLVVSTDGSTLAATGNTTIIQNTISTIVGTVGIYSISSGQITSIETKVGTDNRYAQSVAVSNDGSYIAISNDTLDIVGVYEFNTISNNYTQVQQIVDQKAETGSSFGSKLAFMNNYDSLVVYSQSGSNNIVDTFDEYSTALINSNNLYNTPYVNDSTSAPSTRTTFDKDATQFLENIQGSGRIDVYDRYVSQWVFGENLPNINSPAVGYGLGFAVGNNNIIVGAPYTSVGNFTETGTVYLYNKPANAYSWKKHREQIPVVDIRKVKKAFLYNKATSEMLVHLDIIDPIQGKIAGPADEEIRFKTYYDPAVYSTTDGTSTVNVDTNSFWSTTQVGQLWWDLRTTKFINPYFSDPAYSNNIWNVLAPGASVDVYEWVSSSILPAAWDLQADTPAGLALGISGTSLYGNGAYSIRQRYDTVSKTFKNTYYFWVKNKGILPDVLGRNISSASVSALIANPRGQAYTYLALTSKNSFSIVNASQYLKNSDVVLAIEYWITDKTDQNIHTQWKLISTDTIVDLPTTIEQKWIDSLCGVDSAGRSVPDINLPPKLKYGIENRPRQGMFINRVEALKEFVERANVGLLANQIVEICNIEPLKSYEKEPSLLTGLYDTTLDTDTELNYINVNLFSRPSVMPIITDGKLTGITIVNPGKGYLVAPYIEIVGTGKGARAKAVINSLGSIVSATVVTSGEGYDPDQTTCSVRDYAVLVHSDSGANNSWSIFSYDPTYVDKITKLVTGLWSRTLTQGYDVRNYWKYADWFAPGYNQFNAADFSVATFFDLNTINVSVGQLVKILTVSSSGWVLLEKYATVDSVDWTLSYCVVGIQNGTIQLDSSLYKTDFTAIGYDASTFDSGAFDIKAAVELRIILNTLKNNIFINDLKGTYLDLFFTSIHYAHSEQLYLDWIFKTSFIRATHNVGQLDQPVYYPIDNLSNFQDYIAEVKPYRTKIREYISQYTGIDNTSTAVTDFDMPPTYTGTALVPINTQVINGKVTADLPAIRSYPWKYWLDNVGFSITDIKITSSGSGYITRPVVKITSDSGTGATAEAFFSNGAINRIILTNPGSGYLSAPTVTLVGGLATTGTPATAVAIIGEGVVRSNLVSMKFDRISQKNYIINLDVSETYTGTGSKKQFKLMWAPNIRIGKSTVTIDGIPVLRETYTIEIVKSKTSYTKYTGTITFDTAPSKSSVIVVSYIKDISLLDATDRIEYYYDPVNGMLGKDLSQLMTGIDYGGAIIGNLGFEGNAGWSKTGFMTDKWDVYDNTFTDYIVQVSANTHSFTLPYTPSAGTELNFYYSQSSSTVIPSDGASLEYPYDVYLVRPTLSVSTDVLSTSSANLIKTFSSLATTTQTQIVSTGGAIGQSTITFVSTTNIVVGQFVSGTGIQFNTTVLSVASGIVVLSNNLTADAVGNYVFFTLSTVMTVSSTTGILAGMGVTGVGFTTQTVTTIPTYKGGQFVVGKQYEIASHGTTDFISIGAANNNVGTLFTATGIGSGSGVARDYTTVILAKPPILIPTVGENITFVDNIAGSTTLSLSSTSNIRVGDVVTSSSVDSFSYNTTVSSIIDSTSVTINRILYRNIPDSNTITFTRPLLQPLDVTVYTSGIIVLTNVIPAGSNLIINGKYDYVRIDAGDYSTSTHSSPTNPFAVMESVIADGATHVFSIPGTFVVNDNDEFIIRQSTSDGTIIPAEYDTDISGGDLAYSTARGIAADDIVLDGDALISATTSPALEEVVPGQIVDTLAIKIFDKPSAGSANIAVESFTTDGSIKTYSLINRPVTSGAIIVKLGNSIKTFSVDYTFNFTTNTLVMTNIPAANLKLSVFVIGVSGSNILDIDYFVGDGITTEFITKAPWLTEFTSVVYLNGVLTNPVFFKTDSTYEANDVIGIKFSSPPIPGDLINYIIVSGLDSSFSITNTELITADGSTTYTLQYPVGTSLPNESSMIVRVDQSILSGPINTLFTIGSNRLNYILDSNKVLPYSVSASDIVVIAAGDTLSPGVDYSIDLSGITVKITKAVYSKYSGKILTVSIRSGNGYIFNPTTNQIVFSQAYSNAHRIQVTSSFKHNTLDIQRTSITVTSSTNLVPQSVEAYYYQSIAGGLITLDRSVINENYIWITKNSTLLVPGIDYKMLDNHISIQLTDPVAIGDQIALLTFGSNILKSGISYMQFKDMLNRTTYKRLSLSKRTTLDTDLRWNDTSIVLVDASNFEIPGNKPGVIEIRGERIEYFAKNGNVLSQLRRGTMGTGVVQFNPAGEFVQDIGGGETIPYHDSINTTQVVSNGTSIIPVSFTPVRGNQTTTSSAYEPTGVVSWFANFGYTYSGLYDPVASYGLNSVVVYLNTYYYCSKIVPSIANRTPSSQVAAKIIASQTDTVLTVTSILSGILNVGQTILGTTLEIIGQLSGTAGGTGTYRVNASSNKTSATLTVLYGVDFGPSNSLYWTLYPTTIPVGYGQNNEVDVFVGGYNDAAIWSTGVAYTAGAIVNVGTYTYRCVSDHTSGLTFTEDLANWTFFVGNIRLKKKPYSIFNVNIAPYSPEGDVKFDADFSVDGSSNQIRLTHLLDVGTRVTVIKRTGVAWDSSTNILNDDGKVASFLKASPGIWYATYKLPHF